jgi:hypothetical protein
MPCFNIKYLTFYPMWKVRYIKILSFNIDQLRSFWVHRTRLKQKLKSENLHSLEIYSLCKFKRYFQNICFFLKIKRSSQVKYDSIFVKQRRVIKKLGGTKQQKSLMGLLLAKCSKKHKNCFMVLPSTRITALNGTTAKHSKVVIEWNKKISNLLTLFFTLEKRRGITVDFDCLNFKFLRWKKRNLHVRALSRN